MRCTPPAHRPHALKHALCRTYIARAGMQLPQRSLCARMCAAQSLSSVPGRHSPLHAHTHAYVRARSCARATLARVAWGAACSIGPIHAHGPRSFASVVSCLGWFPRKHTQVRRLPAAQRSRKPHAGAGAGMAPFERPCAALVGSPTEQCSLCANACVRARAL